MLQEKKNKKLAFKEIISLYIKDYMIMTVLAGYQYQNISKILRDLNTTIIKWIKIYTRYKNLDSKNILHSSP